MDRKIHDRLKEARKKLGLSQDYVANQLGLGRGVITAIELGVRKIAAEELKMFSELYGVLVDELLYGNSANDEVKLFARTFSDLSETDRKEIMNLMDFKKRLRKANA